MSQSHAASPIHLRLDAERCLTKAFFSAVFGASVFGAASLAPLYFLQSKLVDWLAWNFKASHGRGCRGAPVGRDGKTKSI